MTAMTVAQKMTAEEFLALRPDLPKAAQNLVEGELVVNRPPVGHQELAARVFVELRKWTEAADGRGYAISEIDVFIDDFNVYEPDVLWYAEGREPGLDDPAPYAVPDLAVEVRSPSTWRHDIGAKKAGYERRGLREFWLVDTPAREVLVFRRSRPDAPTFDVAVELTTDDMLGSPLLEGFALPLDRLFAERD